MSVVDAGRLRVARTMRLRRPVAGIALSSNGDRAVVGPGRRSRKAIVLNTRGRARARRISAGNGPSFVAFSPTAARIYVANSGSGTVTFASGYTYRRLAGSVRVGRRINGMAAQSGCSLIIGTPGPDTLKGDRGCDLIRGLGGTDNLNGFRGNDIVEAGDGDDTASGGIGNDQLDGGARQRQAVRQLRP